MRCFIAIDMSETVKRSLGEVINRVKGSSKDIRWVPVQNVHLTLKFLGEVQEETIPAIEKSLSSVCAGFKPFSITASGIGAFPSLKHPATIWVGLDASGELEQLARAVDLSMATLGFEKEERQFSPHLTIGRVKDRKNIGPVIKELYTFKDTVFGTIDVGEILLMKSVLKPGGAEYSRLACFALTDN
ncbi:MAG: RNA 2',3'-cyclic phosphodiesterase [Nitrospirota bacterium]